MRIVALEPELHLHPRPHLLLRVVDADGGAGVGEASPLPPFSREDVALCRRRIEEALTHLRELDDHAPPLVAIAHALGQCSLDDVPSARFALETALFDLVGRRRGLSVATCLDGSPHHASVPANALLLPEPRGTLADRAARLASDGWSALKIKLRARDDGEFALEVESLRRVRERLPLPFEIRLDANAAWSLDVARRRLDALAPIAPRYVEQPVAAGLLHELGVCAVPWAADESLARPELVAALLASPGGAAFVLKPAIVGGLLRARELAVLAQEHGLGVVVTHLCDGPIAMAAACELAVSLPCPPLACGLAAHVDLDAFAAEHEALEAPQLARGFAVQSSGGPGLGVRARATR